MLIFLLLKTYSFISKNTDTEIHSYSPLTYSTNSSIEKTTNDKNDKIDLFQKIKQIDYWLVIKQNEGFINKL